MLSQSRSGVEGCSETPSSEVPHRAPLDRRVLGARLRGRSSTGARGDA